MVELTALCGRRVAEVGRERTERAEVGRELQAEEREVPPAVVDGVKGRSPSMYACIFARLSFRAAAEGGRGGRSEADGRRSLADEGLSRVAEDGRSRRAEDGRSRTPAEDGRCTPAEDGLVLSRGLAPIGIRSGQSSGKPSDKDEPARSRPATRRGVGLFARGVLPGVSRSPGRARCRWNQL